LIIERESVTALEETQPELPRAKQSRFVEQYGLPEYEASHLTSSRATADFFEEAMEGSPLDGVALSTRAKSVGNWMLGELARLLSLEGIEIGDTKIQPGQVNGLLDLIDAGTLNSTMAKAVFKSGRPPEEIAEETGMVQITDADAVQGAVAEAVEGNPDPVADYLNGKETAMRFLVGQVMKITRGKANPQMAAELLKQELDSLRKTDER
jgi:aspartyl-tRNA(Asn)/glutamyl-tRNA(Gln) amidotransferase subunit B